MDELATDLGANEPQETQDPDADLLAAMEPDEPEDVQESEESEAAPPEEFTVKVNGQEKKVTKEELLSHYQKEAAATQKFEEAAKLRKEAEDAIQNRDRYVQQQQYLAQTIQQLSAQAQLMASEVMLTPEQQQQLLDENPHEYLKWEQRVKQRQGQIAQIQQYQTQLQQQQQAEQQEAQSKYIAKEAQRLHEIIPEWKDKDVFTKETTELRDFLKTRGYTDQDWENLSYSRADNFKLLNDLYKKAKRLDELEAKANAAKARPVSQATQAPVQTLGSKAPARTSKSIVDMNLSDEEFLSLLNKQRREKR